MKNLTALMAAAALLASTTFAPAMYAPIKSGLGNIVLVQADKDKDKGKKDKAKPKPKAKEKKSKDKDKDKGK